MSLAALSLRDLEYVVAVADKGSFVGAAEHCNVSQPSLSLQIRKVEGWAKGQLFERTSRRVLLTPAGCAVRRTSAPRARGSGRPRRNRPRPRPSVRRHAASLRDLDARALFLPKVLGALKERFPDVTLVLEEDLTTVLMGLLRTGDCDCVLMSLPVEEPAFDFEVIFREPFLLAAPAARASRSTPDEILANPAERRAPAAARGTLPAPPSARLLLGRRLEGSARHQPRDAEVHGRGWRRYTLVPALATETGPGVHFSPLPTPEFARDIVLVWRRRDARAGEFRGLAAALRDIARGVRQVHVIE